MRGWEILAKFRERRRERGRHDSEPKGGGGKGEGKSWQREEEKKVLPFCVSTPIARRTPPPPPPSICPRAGTRSGTSSCRRTCRPPSAPRRATPSWWASAGARGPAPHSSSLLLSQLFSRLACPLLQMPADSAPPFPSRLAARPAAAQAAVEDGALQRAEGHPAGQVLVGGQELRQVLRLQ